MARQVVSVLAVGPEVLDVVQTFGRPAAHGIKHTVVVRHDPVDVGKLSVARSGNGLGNRHGMRGQGNGETESKRHEGNETSNGNCTGHGSQRGVEIGFQGAVLGVQGAIRPSGVSSSTV